MNITQALKKLSVQDDDHWTEEGLPRLDVVKILTGNPNLTREELTKTSPNFSRFVSNPVEKNQEKVEVDLTPIKEQFENVQRKISELNIQKNKILNELNPLIIKEQELAAALEKSEGKINPQTAISGYLEGQKRILEERARKLKIMKESGFAEILKEMQKIKAPVDQVRARKK